MFRHQDCNPKWLSSLDSGICSILILKTHYDGINSANDVVPINNGSLGHKQNVIAFVHHVHIHLKSDSKPPD